MPWTKRHKRSQKDRLWRNRITTRLQSFRIDKFSVRHRKTGHAPRSISPGITRGVLFCPPKWTRRPRRPTPPHAYKSMYRGRARIRHLDPNHPSSADKCSSTPPPPPPPPALKRIHHPIHNWIPSISIRRRIPTSPPMQSSRPPGPAARTPPQSPSAHSRVPKVSHSSLRSTIPRGNRQNYRLWDTALPSLFLKFGWSAASNVGKVINARFFRA